MTKLLLKSTRHVNNVESRVLAEVSALQLVLEKMDMQLKIIIGRRNRTGLGDRLFTLTREISTFIYNPKQKS